MRRPAPRPHRIRVERLEDRSVPAFLTPPTVVVGPKGGIGSNPAAIVSADFNRDGRPDLATANNGAQGVSLLLGTGTGGFKPAINVNIGRAPSFLLATDVNGDGKVDVVTANQDNTVTVLLGNGLGGFRSAGTVPAGSAPVWIAAGDFNHDGHTDLVVADSGSGSAVLTVLLGNGMGKFTPDGTIAVGNSPTSVAVGDFNEDGNLDVASVSGAFGHLDINLGNGDGTFSGPANFATGFCAASVVTGDFNHDGHADLAVGCAFPSQDGVSILLGSGNGTFPTFTNYDAATQTPVTLVAADMNNDGYLDLVTANGQFANNSVSVLLGNPDGSFQPATFFTANQDPQGVAVGDFNGDGWADVAVIGRGKPVGNAFGETGTVATLLGNGDGTLVAPTNLVADTQPEAQAVADFNGDGKLDLAVVTTDPKFSGVLLFPGLGGGAFGPAQQAAAQFQPTGVVARNFNGDGKPDLAISTNNAVDVFLNNGDGTFGAPQAYAVSGTTSWITGADFNNDGHPDLLVGTGSGASVLLGNPDGTFQTALGVAVGEAGTHATAGDFNRDGKVDIAAIDNQGDHLIVLLGNGDGTFGTPTIYSTDHSPNSVEVGDFNGDGKPDLAVTTFFGPGLMIFQGAGTGKFSLKGEYQTDSLPIACVIADFTGDHKLDIATINEFGDTVTLFNGSGLGTFGQPVRYVVGDFPTWGSAADFTGDGLPDLSVSNPNSGSVTLLADPLRAVGFRVAVAPATTAGHAVTVTVSAVDGAGHLVPGYTGSVRLTSTDGQALLPAPYMFTPASHGTHRFVVTLRTAGSRNIEAQVGSMTGTGSVMVHAATATHLKVTAPTTATAGSAFDLTVVAADPFGNPDPTYTGTVHFASTDLKPGVTLPVDYPFTGTDAGTHTFVGGATLATAGARTITATAGTWKAIARVKVTAGAVARFLVSGFSASIGAGVSHGFTVTAVDAYGNVVTNYAGIVQFTSSDGSATLPVQYTFTALNKGKHTFTAKLMTAGTQSLTVTDANDSSVTGSEKGITVV
jgi:hypothetical protein